MKKLSLIVVLITMNLSSYAKERDYLIYDSAKEYGLAWGCSNMDIDFTRFDTDEEYSNDVMNNCLVENYVINLYDDRIVQTRKDLNYTPSRNVFFSNYGIGISSIIPWVFNVTNTNFFNVDFYTIEYSSKWESTQDIIASVSPMIDDKARAANIYTCTTCSQDALKAMIQKAGWSEDKVNNFAWNIGFDTEVNPKNNISYLVAKAYGEVPRQSSFAELKADIDLTFDSKTKTFSLKVAKLLTSEYED